MIRNRLRLLARLLVTVKKVEIAQIKDQKAKKLRVSKPSITDIISLFDPEKVQNIMDKQKNKNDDVKDFLHVINRKWADVINKNVEEAQSKQKRKKKEELPSRK